MNLVGKILTVLIFVMSLVFMTCAVAVYATHTNWREVTESKKSDLAKLNTEHAKLKDQRDRLKNEMVTQEKAAETVRAQLETAVQLGKDKITNLQKKESQLNESTRKSVALAAAATDRLVALEGDVGILEVNAAKAESDRKKYFNEAVRLDSGLLEAVNELKRLRDNQQTLQQDYDKAVDVLRHFGLDENADTSETPPVVEGRIVGIAGDTRLGHLAEISIGSDDGLRKGHTLEVYRGTGYVGRIEVIRIDVDRAVCQAIRSFQKSPMQEGDRVASKIGQ